MEAMFFLKEILTEDLHIKIIVEIWSDTFFEGRIVSKDYFLSLPLWQNSLIRINNATVIYKEWLSRSIAKIKHSTDNSNIFISLVSFQNKYEIQIKLLMFFGIIFAIKLLQQQIQTTQLFNTFLKSQKSSRIVYYQLISDKGQ